MLQCNDCGRTVEASRMEKQVGDGPQLKIGLRRTVRDRFGNEIIAEIRCQDCVDGRVPGLPDQEGPGTGAA